MAARRRGRATRSLVLSASVVLASLSAVPAAADARVLGSAATGWSTSTAALLHSCAGATERCDGTIEVPLDWSDPSSERIEVAFAFVPSTDRSRPATGTVLANLGGGGPAIPTVPTLQRALGSVLERQNLLVVDPRGLGRSSPLTCPEIDPGEPDTIAACADQLGTRIQFFAADQHAADLDAVREALGLSQVTFYGNSYGTVFAQAYATRFPRRVAGMFLDSAMPTNHDGYIDLTGSTLAAGFGPSFRMYDAICEASDSCRRLPGTTRERVAEVLQMLREHPDPPINSLRLISMLAYPHDATLGRETNAALGSYIEGDPAPLRRISALLDRTLGGGGPTDPGWAGTLAYACADAAYPFDRSAEPAARRAQLDRYYAEEQPFAPFALDELYEDVWTEVCVPWPTPRTSPVVPAGADLPDVPVLIVNGEHDATTPPAGARSLADRFPRATFQEIGFGRHASALGLWGPYSQCVNATMRDFLAAPRYPIPDRHCTAENYRALGEFPTRIHDVSPAQAPGLDAGTARLVAAAFATAQDAAGRRNPYAELYSLDPADEEPGLRGGTLRRPPDGSVQLDEVRYVDDLAVTGHIAFSADGTTTADLRLAGVHQATLQLTWQPHQPKDRIRITATLDGRPFHATVPTH